MESNGGEKKVKETEIVLEVKERNTPEEVEEEKEEKEEVSTGGGGDESVVKKEPEVDDAVPGCSKDHHDKKDDSLIDLRPGLDSDDSLDSDDDTDVPRDDDDDDGEAVFKRRKLSGSRVKRSNNNEDTKEDEDEMIMSVDDENNESSSAGVNDRPELPSLCDSSSDDDSDNDDHPVRRITRADNEPPGLVGSSDSDTDSDEPDDPADKDADIAALTAQILSKTPALLRRHNFIQDLHHYQLGRGQLMRPQFQQRLISSLDLVTRLHQVNTLAGHEGCVNSLNFNSSGTRLASGSDDLSIIVWDWERGKKMLQFNTGHRANVFQSKIMPGDLLISSCSRDGQVRLAELSVTGSLRSTKKLAQHRGPAHKMSLIPHTQYCLLSAGEDGQVFLIDTREQKPDKILLLKNERDKKVPIYSIHTNPVNGNMFCTSGRDQYIRVFDRRYLGSDQGQVVKHGPQHLRETNEFKAYITCAVFSDDGRELIGSYNDEDIYLFNTDDAEGSDYVHKYQGHRNSATVKGVNFYGSHSEYVISGSDCGNIFIWEKESEALVRLVHGDDGGVVNVLEPHPSLPIIATSGLDDDVKVWMPGPELDTAETQQRGDYMTKTIQKNLSDREKERSSESDPLDGQMLWVLWRHIRRAERRRRELSARAEGEELSDNDSSDESDHDDSDADDGPRGRMCTQS